MSRDAYYQNLQGVWQLNYNMIDLAVSRPIQILEKLLVSPHFGLQNGWIHQKMFIAYLRSFEDRSPDIQIYRDLHTNLKNHFWGIGLRSGVDTSWNIGAGFEVVGRFAGSLLTGQTTSRSTQSTDFQGGKQFLRMQNCSAKNSQIVPGVQTALGLNWNVPTRRVPAVQVSALWEMNYWWGLFGGFIRPNGATYILSSAQTYKTPQYENYPFTNGALILGGITLQAMVSF